MGKTTDAGGTGCAARSDHFGEGAAGAAAGIRRALFPDGGPLRQPSSGRLCALCPGLRVRVGTGGRRSGGPAGRGAGGAGIHGLCPGAAVPGLRRTDLHHGPGSAGLAGGGAAGPVGGHRRRALCHGGRHLRSPVSLSALGGGAVPGRRAADRGRRLVLPAPAAQRSGAAGARRCAVFSHVPPFDPGGCGSGRTVSGPGAGVCPGALCRLPAGAAPGAAAGLGTGLVLDLCADPGASSSAGPTAWEGCCQAAAPGAVPGRPGRFWARYFWRCCRWSMRWPGR